MTIVEHIWIIQERASSSYEFYLTVKRLFRSKTSGSISGSVSMFGRSVPVGSSHMTFKSFSKVLLVMTHFVGRFSCSVNVLWRASLGICIPLQLTRFTRFSWSDWKMELSSCKPSCWALNHSTPCFPISREFYKLQLLILFSGSGFFPTLHQEYLDLLK